jgi:hypothetical protein
MSRALADLAAGTEEADIRDWLARMAADRGDVGPNKNAAGGDQHPGRVEKAKTRCARLGGAHQQGGTSRV